MTSGIALSSFIAVVTCCLQPSLFLHLMLFLQAVEESRMGLMEDKVRAAWPGLLFCHVTLSIMLIYMNDPHGSSAHPHALGMHAHS